MLIYFKLCKSGYAKSVEEARLLDARTVLQALNYEKFVDEYESTYMELNSR